MIVSNSTPLIYLAKIKRLHLLKDVFGSVLIPLEVKFEIVDEGKRKGEADAYLIEQEINRSWLRVEKVNTQLKFNLEIDAGEKATISLAYEKKESAVLIDEIAARTAAKLVKIEPRGTIFVLLQALKLKKINFDEFLHSLTQLSQAGFRLHEEIYTAAIEEARKISSQIKNKK